MLLFVFGVFASTVAFNQREMIFRAEHHQPAHHQAHSSAHTSTAAAEGSQQNSTSTPPMVAAGNCPFPNGTESKAHFFNCDKAASLLFARARVVSDKPNDPNRPQYPLGSEIPVVLELALVNKGTVITNSQLNIQISEWDRNHAGHCAWVPISSQGVFNNLNGCALTHHCPLGRGPQSMRVPLDLRRFFPLIATLKDGHAYQLRIEVVDTSNPRHAHTVGCVFSQARVI